jgi:hypothetical protein
MTAFPGRNQTMSDDDKRDKHARSGLTSVGPTALQRSYGNDDVAKLLARAQRPRDPWAQHFGLFKSRSRTVAKYRAEPSASFILGPWYREENWDSTGNLIAVDRAAAMAVDPWSIYRHEGFYVDGVTCQRLPVPPLRFHGVEYPDVEPAVNNGTADNQLHGADVAISSVTERPALQLQAVEPESDDEGARKAIRAAKQREYRAAKDAGLSMAEWRAREGLPAVTRGRKPRSTA